MKKSTSRNLCNTAGAWSQRVGNGCQRSTTVQSAGPQCTTRVHRERFDRCPKEISGQLFASQAQSERSSWFQAKPRIQSLGRKREEKSRVHHQQTLEDEVCAGFMSIQLTGALVVLFCTCFALPCAVPLECSLASASSWWVRLFESDVFIEWC